MRTSIKSACDGFSEIMLADKQAPSRILLLNDGPIGWEGMEDWIMDSAMAEVVIKAFQEHGTQLVFDYEHSSAEDPGAKGIKAIAAGWITKLSWVPAEGLYADVEWTDQAKMEIESRQYKYHSPVIIHDKKTRAIEKLHSVALTNKPRTKNQRELLAASLSFSSGENVMDLKALRAVLAAAGVKLADDAADDAVLTAASEFIAASQAAKSAADVAVAVAASVKTKLGLSADATKEMVSAKLDEMSTGKVDASEYAAVKARLETVEATIKTRESQELIAKAIETAKLNPNNEKQMAYARDHAKRDPADFQKWMEAAPELYKPGIITKASTTLDKADGSDRVSIIAKAADEWQSSSHLKSLTGKDAFVNDALRSAGQMTLAAGELK